MAQSFSCKMKKLLAERRPEDDKLPRIGAKPEL